MNSLSELKKFAEPHGLTVKDCGNGHLQIIGGPLLVNWWPDSKRRTAYVGSTRQGVDNCSAQMVIKMATTPPNTIAIGAVKRKNSYRKEKIRLLRKNDKCMYCECKLSLDGDAPGTSKATIEHIIPLKRGGLDNANNRGLACGACNNDQGHDMKHMQKENYARRNL